jgi:dTDP-glucose 4,6-dehydratase
MKNLLVTGGAGFIGSNFVHYLLGKYAEYKVVAFDKLTYAGRLENLKPAEAYGPRFAFVRGDIGDRAAVDAALREHQIDTIVNFAAETHVDQSILNPYVFTDTNVRGTHTLLEAARELKLERFHHISTDEVYGQIPAPKRSREGDPFEPRSPYSASKAGAEHLVYAYFITYGVPVTITRGSNNIGPYHYPEKAVPLFTTNAIDNEPLPVYGDGMQQRDYQYVLDHCEGIDVVLHHGQLGEAYNVATGVETHNIDMAKKILDLLGKPHSLLKFVPDRAGHDRRYALDVSKVRALGWESRHTFDQALEKTVRWFVENEWWWRPIKSGEFRAYYERQYGERLAAAR